VWFRMANLGNTIHNTPLGSRIVFSLSAFSYFLFNFAHHDFIAWDLTCKPSDVVYSWQFQRLIFASFVHTSLPGLLLAFLVCWRRFSWIEHQLGSLGFVVWFVWASVVLHGFYCIAMVCVAPFLGFEVLGNEVQGLFPLVIANLVLGMKDSDNEQVWLWPFPFYVSTRVFPLVIIALSWLLHAKAHYDVISAFCVASTLPTCVLEPSQSMLEMFEQTAAGQLLLSFLQSFDSFVCRPPSKGSFSQPTSQSGRVSRPPGFDAKSFSHDAEIGLPVARSTAMPPSASGSSVKFQAVPPVTAPVAAAPLAAPFVASSFEHKDIVASPLVEASVAHATNGRHEHAAIAAPLPPTVAFEKEALSSVVLTDVEDRATEACAAAIHAPSTTADPLAQKVPDHAFPIIGPEVHAIGDTDGTTCHSMDDDDETESPNLESEYDQPWH